MKQILKYGWLVITIMIMVGCGNEIDYDKYVYPAADNKDSLELLVGDCQSLADNSEVGSAQGQYLDFVMHNFKNAINEARKVLLNSKATQAMVDAAKNALAESRQVFKSSVNTGPVDSNDTYLSLHLRFTDNFIDSSPFGHQLSLVQGNAQ